MKASPYEEILREAEQLSREEQWRLVEDMLVRLRVQESAGATRPRWADYAGRAPYPMCGEDAQAWVSRTRAEADREVPPR
jgi:hypothetical protein